VCWGHDTGVGEANILDFAGNWSGTGAITGAGDAEAIELDVGEYMISEIVDTGDMECVLLQNSYDASGDDVIMEYRTGATASECFDAAWTIYTVPFVSEGYVQIKLTNADVFYVDATGGSDDNPGTEAEPWQTITKVNAATLTAGDHVLFKRGETFATNTRLVCADGVTYSAYGTGAKPILNGGTASGAITCLGKTNITIQQLDARSGTGNCVYLGGTYLTMQDCDVSLSGGEGISISGLATNVHHVTVSRCTSHNNTIQGIYVGNAGSVTGGPTDVIIEDCTIYSNGTVATQHHGIYAQDGLRYTIRRNTCYSNIAVGIVIKDHGSGSNSLVERNKCYSNGQYGIEASNLNSGSNIIVRNNICYSNTTTNLWVANATIGAVFYHNTLVNAVGTSSGNGLQVSATASGNLIKNNIIVQDASVVGNVRPYRFADDTCLAANTWNNNCVYYPNNTDSDKVATRTSPAAGYTWLQWQALSGTPDVNGINVDPEFVTNYTDLHLQATSDCIAAGVAGLVIDDYDGVARGVALDIGALEYVA